MNILVITDGDSPATRAAVTAAQKISAEVDVIATGALLAEELAPTLANIATRYTHVFAPATSFGKDVLPRMAALLDCPQVSEVVQIIDAHTFSHPIYAGNAIETVRVNAPIVLATIRHSAFAKAETVRFASITLTPAATTSRFVSLETTPSERPELTAARVVVAGGRGLGSKENFALIAALADRLNAAIGASRAAVDAGYVPNEYQVGQTGKIVAPELYIAVGISGAIQHVAGMKDSNVIVAINKDENAPIFDIADYGLVGDLFAILPELEALL